jgi:hypothetical protein
MKSVLRLSAVVVVALATAVQAGPPATEFVSPDPFVRADIAQPHGGPVPLPYFTGFETAEGFLVGHINGQQGWATGAAPDTWPQVSTLHPAAGNQHLIFQDDPAAPPAFGSILGFGPSHDPAGYYSVQVSISNTGGSNYYLNPQSPSLALSCTRVAFAATDQDADTVAGDILVISDPDGPGPAPSAFFNTGVEHTPGVYKEFRIEHVGSGQYNYFYDGVQIAGPLFGFHNAAGVTCNGWQEMVYIDDQGSQAVAGEHADFDNHLEVVPEPGTLGLIGLAVAVLLRRRR